MLADIYACALNRKMFKRASNRSSDEYLPTIRFSLLSVHQKLTFFSELMTCPMLHPR